MTIADGAASTAEARPEGTSSGGSGTCDGTAADDIREHYNIHILLKQV